VAVTMTGRERVLLIVTGAFVILALLYHFGLKGGIGALAGEREQLRREEQTYDDYIGVLRREPELNQQYQKLEQRYPMTVQRAKEFTATIEKQFRAFRMTGINISPPEEEVIEDAEDHGFVTLRIRCDGDIEKVAQMLGFFNHQAILVKELRLRAYLDSPRINVEVSVSQIVRLSEEMKAKIGKQAGPASGGRSQARRRVSPGL